MEMHRRKFCHSRKRHVDVRRLGLINVRAAVNSHISHYVLVDLPDLLVELLRIGGHN